MKFQLIVASSIIILSQHVFAQTNNQNKESMINNKITNICQSMSGQIELNNKGIIICRVSDKESEYLNKKYLDNMYDNINEPSLFIAWDIKDKEKYSYTLSSNKATKQKTIEKNNNKIDLYVYYSNIKNEEKRKASIKPANTELINKIAKKTIKAIE